MEGDAIPYERALQEHVAEALSDTPVVLIAGPRQAGKTTLARRSMAVSDRDCRLLHYRDHDQVEVDFVIEDGAGRLVGVEVKSGATIKAADLRGPRRLASIAGERWVASVILYDGTEPLPFSDGLWALRLATLWG